MAEIALKYVGAIFANLQFWRMFIHFFEIFPALLSRISTKKPVIVNKFEVSRNCRKADDNWQRF